MELLGQRAVPFLVFWGNSILFSTVAASVYIPTNSAAFPFLHILSNTCLLICLRWPFSLVWMTTINKSTNNKCWRDCGEKGTLVHCWWEWRLAQPLWKTVWTFLRKLKMEPPFDPAIPLLGLYPKNPETLIQKGLCTPMFIAPQFTIAKCWKQPKSLSVNEWIKKNGTFTQWNSIQQKERRNFYPLWQHGWKQRILH